MLVLNLISACSELVGARSVFVLNLIAASNLVNPPVLDSALDTEFYQLSLNTHRCMLFFKLERDA